MRPLQDSGTPAGPSLNDTLSPPEGRGERVPLQKGSLPRVSNWGRIRHSRRADRSFHTLATRSRGG
uniref:Uncharacterized protein n=1 Tax=uncultured marine group II/III euryarchaeote AD1000_35_F01 TaxID=1457758 RepID=A0A075FQ11_9EURY|nr:hypothetical protein [uncultured marine group II/III euryarchaeote AD1000_35_F01]